MTRNERLATVFIGVPLSVVLTLALTRKIQERALIAVIPIGFALGVFTDAAAVRADEEYGQDQD
jgi:hypothetical protein